MVAIRACIVVMLATFMSASAAEISFRNDIMAVLSKAGCNAGTCHGNKNGKGGFSLSLRGQDPAADYISLTRDVFGRRANALTPDDSLLLLKPTTQVAHEGGHRFATGSREYEMLHAWIGAGMPNDLHKAPKLLRVEVSPSEQVLVEPAASVQLRARAIFDDETSRDVTSLSVYEAAGTRAKISSDGLFESQGYGECTVLVRYLEQQVPVRLAFVPSRPKFKWPNPKPLNYIDEQIYAKLRTLRIEPSPLCSDATFVRRAYLDLLGILPTADEARDFVADKRSAKRQRLTDALLERSEFADFWALKWADLLRVEAHSLDQKGVQNFHHWIRQNVATNTPVDQFVRELIAGRGSTYGAPPSNFYRPNRDPTERARAAAQVFLGTRLRCAECHNHPSDRWSQDDYYDWAGLFAGVGYKVIENNREISSDQHEWNGEQVIFVGRKSSLTNPRTGKPAQPRFLGNTPNGHAAPHDASEDPLQAVAQWLTSPTNAAFARVQVNRIWFHLMGRGLVNPPDDYRATNPASHPALLDLLATDFVKHGYDLRYMIRLIMNSATYQVSSEANDEDDDINYSHAVVRRLGAEQMLDCQSQVTGVPLRFAGYPAGMRAAQLPGVRPESKGKRRASKFDQFLDTFGKPPRLLSSDTERSCECNMGQAFQMITGPTVTDMLATKTNRVTELAASSKPDGELIDELFWSALTRAPKPGERTELLETLSSAKDRRKELEDMFWALLNSKEFLFRQ
jgi:hypothetical protein